MAQHKTMVRMNEDSTFQAIEVFVEDGQLRTRSLKFNGEDPVTFLNAAAAWNVVYAFREPCPEEYNARTWDYNEGCWTNFRNEVW